MMGLDATLNRLRPAAVFAAVALACIAAVAAALVSQHVFDMQPCPWCVLQRLIFLTIALACGLGLLWRSATGRRIAAGLGLLLALSGVAVALWHYFVATSSASCVQTLADKIVSSFLELDTLLPEVFAPRASCADGAVKLLGIPYPFWSLALFVVAGFTLLQVLRRRDNRSGRR
jgi:disulfide bond formation protein DsbB